jgi:hypothetical protein
MGYIYALLSTKDRKRWRSSTTETVPEQRITNLNMQN